MPNRFGRFVVGGFYENRAKRSVGGLCLSVAASGNAHLTIVTDDEGLTGPAFCAGDRRSEWREVWPAIEPLDLHSLPAAIREHPGFAFASINDEKPVSFTMDKPPAEDKLIALRDPSGRLVWEHAKAKGWRYPSMFHEQPGIYEDENGVEWHYVPDRDGEPCWWQNIDTGNWHPVPENGKRTIAVRWLEDFDNEESGNV